MSIGRKPLGNYFLPRFSQPLVMKIVSKSLSYVALAMEYSHEEGPKTLKVLKYFYA
jgi:hypothetical protein